MKYFLSFLFSVGFGFTSFGQAHVTSSGISIQGIARDANNAAQTNISQLSLDFKIYYLGAGNSEELIHQESGNVATDDFGVFSYVIDISNDKYVQISNAEAYLKVEQGGTVFSNEKLHTVPYAIHAQNGVPTGSILPFIGTSSQVPEGWLLCDGSTFTRNVYTEKLYQLLGNSNTLPNLGASYLRGIGGHPQWTGYQGPSLRSHQGDRVKNHQHSINIDTQTNNDGEHKHQLPYDSQGGSTSEQSITSTGGDDEEYANTPDQMKNGSAHRHRIQYSGNTGDANNQASENRVFGYGVNYIIKI